MSHPAALLPITVYLNPQHTSSITVHVSAASQHPIIDLKRAIATTANIHPSVQRLSLVGGVDGFTVPTAVELTVRPRIPTLTITIETMQDKMVSPYPERVKKEIEMVEKDQKMIVRLGAASPSIPPSALIPNLKKGPLPANFQVDSKDTILDLKFLLADVISIAPEHQRLYIRRRGERSLIHDTATITSAGLNNGEVLKVQFEYPSNQPHHGTVHRTAIKLTEYDHPQIPDLGTNFRVASVKYGNRKFLGVRSFSSDLKTRGPYVWQTYNDIATRVSHFGAGMRHLGLTKEDTIGIMSQNRTEWIIADLVCSVQSFVSVPLYDTLGHDAAKYIINHASVKAVVVSVAQLKDIVAIRSQCPTLSHLIVMDDTPLDKHNLKSVTGYTHKFSEVESVGSKYVTTYPDVLPGYNDLSTICYTSGTTGNPKGVLITHGNLIATIAAFNERLRQEPQLETETVLSYLPLAHIYERIVDSTLISEGYAIGFFQGDTLKLAEDVAELKPTVFPGVPRVWQRIYDKIHAQIEESNIIRRTLFDKAYQSRLEALRNGDTSPSLWDKIVFKKVAERFGGNIRMLSSGAAPLPAKVAEFMKIAFMCHFLEGYGLTETCAAATSMSVDDTQFGNVGAVQGSVEIKLVSVPDMEYLVTDKPNPRGEIWIRGPSIFKGYYKQQEATKECMTEDGWFMSGDVGTWLPNGNLKIIDRKKNIFKLSQGEYIKPEHIENILKQSKLVANIYVHGDSQQNFLVGVVVPDFETLQPLAAAAGSKAKTPAELVADPKIEKLIMSDLNRISAEAKLQKFEYVKRIHISKEDFTVDNGLLTPTFKLKRFVCAKHYARELSDLYASGLPSDEKIQSKL